jgi:hypothetical protein
MKLRTLIVLAGASWSLTAWAQQVQPAYGIAFSGFVKTDLMFDSRQTDALREGHFLLYPAAPDYDKNGKDANERPTFNMLSIQTRLAGKITGPDALGAKTSGLIEGEFFGTSNADESGFRLRHAFVKLDWGSSALLIGQYWHPMFVTEVYPGVVSFNTGAPFQPFSRNPQVRFTHNVENLRLIAAAMSQRDFSSDGPVGLSSSYLRNSIVPNLHLQAQYAAGAHLFGAGIDYKVLTPRTKTAKNVKADATIGSMGVLGYAKVNIDPITVKAEAAYGENLSDLLLLGGYAVSSLDTVTGIEGYSSLRSYSVWGEITTGKELEFGLFGGFSKNLGADRRLVGPLYGRGTSINTLLRISPRVVYTVGSTRFCFEVEYSSAEYGTPVLPNNGKVQNLVGVANLRALAAVYYMF